MYETEIKLSGEQQNFIKTAMKGNFHKIQFIKNINYQEVSPPFIRTYLRRLVGLVNFKQKNLITNFDLTNLIDAGTSQKENIWPSKKKCAFISTHDIDTAFGQDYIENYFEIEKELNIRSTNFWVTHLYKLNNHLLHQAVKNAFEIGLHDYNHDGKLVMLNQGEIKNRISLSQDFIKEYSVEGVRSPGFLRSMNFYSAIKDLFNYDMSIVDYSFLFPYPGDGCRTSQPLLFENLILFPSSLIRDGEALALGLKPKEILNTWIMKYNWLKSKNGLIVLLTHPDKGFSGRKDMLEIYKTFLEYVKNDHDCWISTAGELAKYLKQNKRPLIQTIQISNNDGDRVE